MDRTDPHDVSSPHCSDPKRVLEKPGATFNLSSALSAMVIPVHTTYLIIQAESVKAWAFFGRKTKGKILRDAWELSAMRSDCERWTVSYST